MEEIVKIEEVTIIATDFIKVTYNKKQKLISTEWLKNPSEKEYKNVFTAMMDKVEEEQLIIHNAYADVRRQGIISPANRKWYEETVFPKLLSHGVKRGSVFIDANVFKTYYINTIFKTVNKFGIPLKVFNSKEKAMKFLSND